MGLAISVGLFDYMSGDEEGVEWMKDELVNINKLLTDSGFPAHEEPLSIKHPPARGHISSFPYSFIHYLRRVIAYANTKTLLTPVLDDESPTDDPILEREYGMLDSHIICHSDTDGYYIPTELGSEPLFDLETGIAFGSCQCVIRELTNAAPLLGINIEDGKLSDAEAAKLAAVEDDQPYFREIIGWFTMWESATLSIDQNAILVFH